MLVIFASIEKKPVEQVVKSASMLSRNVIWCIKKMHQGLLCTEGFFIKKLPANYNFCTSYEVSYQESYRA